MLLSLPANSRQIMYQTRVAAGPTMRIPALQPNSTLAPTAVNATIGNANPLGRVSAVQPFAEAPGCMPTVYDLLKTNRNATTFLRLANLTGVCAIVPSQRTM